MPRALLLDFNGTLSDDESLLCEIYVAVFAECGKALTPEQYHACLAGRSTREIVASWLGPEHPAAEWAVDERRRRYALAAADGRTIAAPVRAALESVAERVAIGIVSGAERAEIDLVLRAAGLADLVGAVVARDDVVHPKPNPEPYLLALERLGVGADEALAVEDTDVGVAAAVAAGIPCAAIRRPGSAQRLDRASRVVTSLDGLLEELEL